MKADYQNKFKAAILDLTMKEYDCVISEVRDACNISVSTWYRWLKQPEKIKLPYKNIIAKIMQRDISEIF